MSAHDLVWPDATFIEPPFVMPGLDPGIALPSEARYADQVRV